MKDTQNKSLLMELTNEDSATVNGGRYYRPCYYSRRHRPSYHSYNRPSYGSGYGYGGGYAVNQVTNVNVLIND
jgi:hypothetical protein